MTDRTMNTDRLRGMLDDPELGGDLLLVGLGLLAIRDLGRTDLRKLLAMERTLWAGTRGRLDGFRVRRAVIDDARTYKMPWSDDERCLAPTPRKPACGRRRTGYFALPDYATGQRYEVRYCSKHREWANRERAASRAAAPDPSEPWGGAPLPCANHGGVLRRHFPEFDWPKLWRAYDPRWVEHPEEEPWPKPRFTLLVGDDEATGTDDRPLLTRVDGGAS